MHAKMTTEQEPITLTHALSNGSVCRRPNGNIDDGAVVARSLRHLSYAIHLLKARGAMGSLRMLLTATQYQTDSYYSVLCNDILNVI